MVCVVVTMLVIGNLYQKFNLIGQKEVMLYNVYLVCVGGIAQHG